MKLALSILVGYLIVLNFPNAYSQSATPTNTQKDSVVRKASGKIATKVKVENKKEIDVIYSGVFDFKGESIGLTYDSLFGSSGKKNRIYLGDMREVVGYLKIDRPKEVKSEDFSYFICSKELGAIHSKGKSDELRRKRIEAQKNDALAEIEGLKPKPSYQSYVDRFEEMKRLRDKTLYAEKLAIQEEVQWFNVLKNSETGWLECTDTIANRRILVNVLEFYNDVLGRITVVFDSKDFSVVLAGLTEKYGQPNMVRQAQLNYKLSGAPTGFTRAVWKDSKGSLLVVQSHEQDGDVFREKAFLNIVDPGYLEKLEQEKSSNGVVPASKDL